MYEARLSLFWVLFCHQPCSRLGVSWSMSRICDPWPRPTSTGWSSCTQQNATSTGWSSMSLWRAAEGTDSAACANEYWQ